MSPLAGLKNLRWLLLLPRLRRGLNDCARFAGFQAAANFRLTLMRRKAWKWNNPPRRSAAPAGAASGQRRVGGACGDGRCRP